MYRLRPLLTRPLSALALALLTRLATPGLDPAGAQDRVDIRFDPGCCGTTINGAIIAIQYIDCTLGIGAEQQLDVSLTVTATNGNGTGLFQHPTRGQGLQRPVCRLQRRADRQRNGAAQG